MDKRNWTSVVLCSTRLMWGWLRKLGEKNNTVWESFRSNTFAQLLIKGVRISSKYLGNTKVLNDRISIGCTLIPPCLVGCSCDLLS